MEGGGGGCKGHFCKRPFENQMELIVTDHYLGHFWQSWKWWWFWQSKVWAFLTYSIYSNINKIHGKTPDMKSYTSHTKPWSTVSSNSKIRPTGTTKCSISLLSNYWDLADCKPLQSTPLIKRSLLHPSDYTHIYICVYTCAYVCVYMRVHIYIYIYT